MSVHVYIYGLVDPETNEIRYIGKSIRPKERLTNHCNEQSVTYRTNWLKQLKGKGLQPKLIILECLPENTDWREKEKEWIKKGREQGWPLTNCTDGGDGVEGLPLEIRQKMRLVWLGRKHKPESLAKIGAASKQRKWTEERRELMRQKFKGRKFSKKWINKIAKSNQKLTKTQIIEILHLLAKGVNQYDIAARYGVHQGTISNINRKLSYTTIITHYENLINQETPIQERLPLWK